jgi:uncharacterized protein (TIGR02453 family)
MAFAGFQKDFFAFLRDLAAHNDREWFEANKQRYKDKVVAPVCTFIEAIAPRLRKISPHFVADPRPHNGSMFRIYRDKRFGKDKSPYKTNTGVQFRHAAGKDAHAPGFYLHLEPKNIFYGGGVWMPAPAMLSAVRDRIVADPSGWTKARNAPSVKETYGDLGDGHPLAKAPRGYDEKHLHVADLRKRSFFVIVNATENDAGKPAFLGDVAEAYMAARPVMRFLTQAAGQPF